MGERVAVALKRDTLRDRVGAMDLKRPGEGRGRGEQALLEQRGEEVRGTPARLATVEPLRPGGRVGLEVTMNGSLGLASRPGRQC